MEGKGRGGKGGREEREEKGKGGGKGPSPPEKKFWRRHWMIGLVVFQSVNEQ